MADRCGLAEASILVLLLSVFGIVGAEFVASSGGMNEWGVERQWAHDAMCRLAEEVRASHICLTDCQTFENFGERIATQLTACPFMPKRENPFPAVLYPGGRYGRLPGIPSGIATSVPFLWFTGSVQFQKKLYMRPETQVPVMFLNRDSPTNDWVLRSAVYMNWSDLRTRVDLVTDH